MVARGPRGLYLKPYHWTGRTAVTPTPFGDSCRPAQSPQPPGSTSCSHQQSDHPLLSTGQALTSTVAYHRRVDTTRQYEYYSVFPHAPITRPAVLLPSAPSPHPHLTHRTPTVHTRDARRSPSASLDPTWPCGLKGSPHSLSLTRELPREGASWPSRSLVQGRDASGRASGASEAPVALA